MECDGKLPFVEVPKRKTMILPLSYFKASQLSMKNLEIIGDNRTVEEQVFGKVSQYEIMSKQILKSAELHVFRIAVFNYLALKIFSHFVSLQSNSLLSPEILYVL